MQDLQAQLAELKTEYMSGPKNRERDNEFANREMDLCRRFRAIKEQPSYPPGFLEKMRRPLPPLGPSK
ncbi:hypothetical protein JDN40_14480 [Rhodomicrobium vannielii ATCC 17100]|uniref:hypothetical protein n=1 Tax=Rhodomicrobium vannielii TaxID=1069 RepID=UPI0019195294|nr:hypothetical protein [Rhodomicrobium vannielii]MBJ7535315.1 hypothetical protein [Rhodomicrobium vannielii ATCC 17100]